LTRRFSFQHFIRKRHFSVSMQRAANIFGPFSYINVKRCDVKLHAGVFFTCLCLTKLPTYLAIFYYIQLLQRCIVFLRAIAECFAPLSHGLGVCPSVCSSATLLCCVKTTQARITKSSLWSASRILVYGDKISCPWMRRFPSNEGVKEGYPLKRRHFAVIGSYNVKTVADRYKHAAYHNKHW